VVFLTFKAVKSINWKEAFGGMKNLLSDLYSEYEYLKDTLRKHEVTRFDRILEGEGSLADYESSLKDLTKYLWKHHGKKVILLIDEYDVPIEAAYVNREKDTDYYDNMVSFMRGLLTEALKDNEYLEFAVMTGVFRVAKESIFSGLNNLDVYTVFDNAMTDKFGFTQEEVDKLLEDYGLGEEDKEKVRQWYNGYRIGEREGIYNPWSVLNYVTERISDVSPDMAVQPYWINTSSNDLIIEQIENNDELGPHLGQLIEGGEVRKVVDRSMSLRDMETNKSAVWTLLVSGGYLNAKFLRKEGRMDLYSLSVPNEEVKYFYETTVSNWIENRVKIDGSQLEYMLKSLLTGNIEEFAEVFKRFVYETLSYYDVSGSEKEVVYKAFVLGMLVLVKDGYVVKSEGETRRGRYDVAIYPRGGGRYGVVMEFKSIFRGASDRMVEEELKMALKQIEERGYGVDLKAHGVEKVINLAVVFRGKEVFTKWKVET